MADKSYNFYTDDSRGQEVFRCCLCPYDTFNIKDIPAHAATHQPTELPGWDRLRDYIMPDLPRLLENARPIVISILTSPSCWPTQALKVAFEEKERLEGLGLKVLIYWADNASAPEHLKTNMKYTDEWSRTAMDVGQSAARNKGIDYALKQGASYLLMVDGDIELIPYSLFAMAVYMRQPENAQVGCIGMYSRNCTNKRDEVAECCFSLHGHVVPMPHMAWTQYGLFHCDVFRAGVRFDTDKVFLGPGWGFEDDDLGLQMLDKDYKCHNTRRFRYGHYSIHSSLKQMPLSLASKVFERRKEYVYNKWKLNPKTAYLANQLQAHTLPKVDTK